MGDPSEKIRLKFRVSSLTEPKWTEKWGVSLTASEEFHVTDRLLKLPFQENAPKTVCRFSVEQGILQFHQVDLDRLMTLNGMPTKDSHPKIGDQIRIGGTIQIEVVLAPAKEIQTTSFPATPVTSTFSNLDTIPEIKSDGPTLTTTTTTSHSLEIREPSLKMVQTEMPLHRRGDTYPGTTVPTPPPPESFCPPEPKVELASSPHLQRDDSLEERMAAMTESELDGVRPLYLEKTKLSSKRLSISEKILTAVARVLRRDELNPPVEQFPLDKESTNSGMVVLDQPLTKSIQTGRNEFSPSPQVVRKPMPQKPQPTKPQPKVWTPSAASSGARMRGRALVFVVGAAGALMLAVAFFKFVNPFGSTDSGTGTGGSTQTQFKKGIPVEVLEEKVRKMRRLRERR